MTKGVSLVIPCFNEESSIASLYQKIKQGLSKAKVDKWEVIFVDDGSKDGTLTKIEELNSLDKRVKLISFRVNKGKAAALQAGFDIATYEVIITMDGDLQDDPEEIVKFLEKIDEGYDLVSGWKQNRKDSFIKNQSSKIFNFFTGLITKTKLHDFNCGFKAYKQEVVKSINLYGELHRYIPVLAEAKGFKITEIPVRHHARKHGKSKYNWERFFKGYFDLVTVLFITRFKYRPLHMFGYVGMFFLVLGVAIGGYLSWLRLVMNQSIGDRPLLLLSALLIIIGVQIMISGLVAELILATNIIQENNDIKKKL